MRIWKTGKLPAIWGAALLAACLLCTGAWAVEGACAWGSVQAQTAVVYLKGVAGDEVAECTIGNVLVQPSSAQDVAKLEKPVETVILLDNSASLTEGDRQGAADILMDLIANRLSGETYSIATVADTVSFLCEGETDFARLKAVVNGLEYYDQSTYMVDGICTVLDQLKASDEGVLRRLVVISDGEDHQTLGYTLEEMYSKAAACGYPVYVVGCQGSGNSQSGLKDLFALARASSGATFNLGDGLDSLAVVNVLTEWNQACRLEIPIPDEVCDGSEKVVGFTGSAGQSCSVVLAMPVVAAPPPPAEPEVSSSPTPEPSEQPKEPSAAPAQPPEETSQGPGWMLWAGLGVAVLAAVAGTAVFLIRKKKKTAKKGEFEHLPVGGEEFPYMGETVLEMPPSAEEGGSTVMIWNQDAARTLILQDIHAAQRKFDAPLQGVVSIGRDASCTVPILWDPTVSRHQCEISQKGGQAVVRNISTSNATWLDGRKIEGETPLSSGSILKMGHVELRVSIM